MESLKIRWHYDPHTKLWIIQVLDAENNQQGEALYVPKAMLYPTVKNLCIDLKITDVRKYRKGE